jgi:hypothetical protein
MKIAPRELIWKDFRKMQKEHDLYTSPEVEDLLFMQTIEGHSHNGDGAFEGKKFVDTTIDDIVIALGRDSFIVRSSRQLLIDEIYEYARAVMNGERRTHLVNKKGEPLMRCPLFLEIEVDPYSVLRGLYLGGFMDDFETRKLANMKFNLNMGGGKPYLVDMHVMEKLGLDGEQLAHGDHEDKLDEYRRVGLIIDPSNVDFLKHSYIRFQYIRHKKGLGVSDDLAVLVAGKLYNISAGLGAYLADAIDTLDKFSLHFYEQDEALATEIEKNFKNLNLTRDDVLNFIRLIAIPEGMESDIPDSSQRYFLEINKDANMTTLESHIRYLEGLPYPQFKIAYERIYNTDLYRYLEKILG